jgi:hypothetical protein
VGVEGRIVKGLGLVAEAAAQHPDEAFDRWGHRGNLEVQEPEAERRHLPGHRWSAHEEGMLPQLIDDQFHGLLGGEILPGADMVVALPGVIERLGEAVGIVEDPIRRRICH